MHWFARHSNAFQGIAALVTACAAVAALILVPLQITSADRIQRDQTAREIYREFLNLTVQRPELAVADSCALPDARAETAYAAYVEYMLYTAEQMLEVSEDWRAPMLSHIAGHTPYLCGLSEADLTLYSDATAALIRDARAGCAKVSPCG